MNKNAIKKFAIEARKKLIASVSDRAGMLGITPKGCSEPVSKGADFEVYKTIAGTEITLGKTQCEQRRKLKEQVGTRGFEAVVEEVAYTWFNRICAIRFMEVNDYLPTRVRVLSSEKEGKNEPDIVTQAPDVDLDFTDKEREYILDCKMNNKLDDLFKMLFIKQCNKLSEILPELFEATEDYTEMLLNISYTNKDDIIYLLVNQETGIPEADFNVSTIGEDGQPTGQVEIIGWLYQYYNTELKDDTFAQLKKNVKISKERIPAATQLFTPDWIVRYMVENSVGRLWIEHLRAVDPTVNEKEVAEKFGWKYYLPEAEQEADVDVKLAEIRTAYKDLKPEDITCIDPCMGSGHILVAMFDVLMDIYKSAGYSERDAAFEIVEHNIHGLDIDKRAYQLAYFAVMMKGRGYNRRFLNNRDRAVPKQAIYYVVESGYIDKDGNRHYEIDNDTLEYFVNNNTNLKKDILLIIDAMLDAREYGSIIQIPPVDFNKLFERFNKIEEEISLFKQPVKEMLYPIVSVAYMLISKYDVVVTNPPYMGASGMGTKLSKYVKDNYSDSKSDLFAVFIEKCGQMTKKNCYQAMITQHAWMFLSGFDKLREKLRQIDIINMAHLGARAFEEIGGEVVQTTSFVMRKSNVNKYKGIYCRLVEPTTQQGKEDMYLVGENRYAAIQDNFSKIPGNPVAYWLNDSLRNIFDNEKLEQYAECCTGMQTGNNEKYVRLWFEPCIKDISVFENDKKYIPYNCGGERCKWYGNNYNVVLWDTAGEKIRCEKSSVIRNEKHFFEEGISWKRIASSGIGLRYLPKGYIFDQAGDSMFVKDKKYLKYLLGFFNTVVCEKCLEILAPTMNLTAGNMNRLPIIIEDIVVSKITDLVNENIYNSKKDWDNCEFSWDFKKHPLLPKYEEKELSKNDVERCIKEKVSISACFSRWEKECLSRFENIKNNEEELNRIFINIYDLQDELMPEVEDKDITIHKADLGRDIRSFISYAVGCMFGRYSLAKEGLMFAGGQMTDVYQHHSGKLDGQLILDGKFPMNGKSYYYFEGNDYLIDGDNVIPITDEEYFSDDIVSRFVEFVRIIYGEDTLEENLNFIANALGNKGDTSGEVIRNYFLKDFYAEHLKIYQKRPIYWMFDSGKQNGFKALIYMHRYDKDTVGRVRTDYLHKAQKYIETAMSSAQYAIDNSSSASEKSKATKAVTKYTKQLAEMKIYDEAIAHIANQRIEIDLDDGVKVNYAKFQGVEVAQEGKKALKVDLLAKI